MESKLKSCNIVFQVPYEDMGCFTKQDFAFGWSSKLPAGVLHDCLHRRQDQELMLSVFGAYLTFFFTAPMVEVEKSDYPPPPFNLSLYKGIKSYRLPRWFVSFLLTHPVARDFLDWVMFTAHAEEHAVPTLARISRTHLLDNGTWQVTQNREVEVEKNFSKQLLYINIIYHSVNCQTVSR